jgi:macrolide transport system ATP-binding/permease protein
MRIIEARNIDFAYGDKGKMVSIFTSLSLHINKGEFVAIKGPSGSGKSTLLYLLSGLLHAQRGDVHINKTSLRELSDLELATLRNQEIGFVFQQFHLIPSATARQNILLPRLYPIEVQATLGNQNLGVETLAEELGISNRLQHTPNQLSGGQQQRVAIARALINQPNIILADEPTGNLDSASSQQIMKILKDLHKQGKTIVLITHDEEVARCASRRLTLKDGRLIEETRNKCLPQTPRSEKAPQPQPTSLAKQFFQVLGLARANTFRHRARSILTMLGITVGVAALCSLMTLGQYTKDRVLESYTELGANSLIFRGYPNFFLSDETVSPAHFDSFDWESEVLPLKKIFPQIALISPRMRAPSAEIFFSGMSMTEDIGLLGVSEEGLQVFGREIKKGYPISKAHIVNRDVVCLIGNKIADSFFKKRSPIGSVILIAPNERNQFPCRVIGVLAPKSTNRQWGDPNRHIYLPHSSLKLLVNNWWERDIHELGVLYRPGTDMELAGKALRKFFKSKYGNSGAFMVDQDSVLLAQMEKFLSLFSILLLGVALVTLVVGGMGITNMMLVSVSERLKEIGIRKSVGATHRSIRYQFLMESLLLCSTSGFVGLAVGFIAYQSAIYTASRLIEDLSFEWVINPWAILTSFIAILAVGILSGLIPALKAERLQVIDVLRSE